jgi:hypothetical protein
MNGLMMNVDWIEWGNEYNGIGWKMGQSADQIPPKWAQNPPNPIQN